MSNNLEILKQNIQNGSVSDSLIIFELSDTDFVSNQYITEIAKIKNKQIHYIDDLNILFEVDIFGQSSISDNELVVCNCKKLTELNSLIFTLKNVIIVTSKVEDSLKDLYASNIFVIPKLEQWQIKDYVYSTQQSIPTASLDELIEKCNYNIYRIDNELAKLNIFTDAEKPYVFNDFISDNVFSDLSKYKIFDLTNAIIKKDIPTLINIYKEKDNIDIEPLGVVTILLNSFRDIITLQFDPRLTAETSGIPKNRFWAIKYNCGIYSNKQLMQIFKLLCDIDKQLKTGYITTDLIVDYLIVNILK